MFPADLLSAVTFKDVSPGQLVLRSEVWALVVAYPLVGGGVGNGFLRLTGQHSGTCGEGQPDDPVLALGEHAHWKPLVNSLAGGQRGIQHQALGLAITSQGPAVVTWFGSQHEGRWSYFATANGACLDQDPTILANQAPYFASWDVGIELAPGHYTGVFGVAAG